MANCHSTRAEWMIQFPQLISLHQAVWTRRILWKEKMLIVRHTLRHLTGHRQSHCSTGFFHVLDDLEQFTRANNDPVALNAVKESRAALGKLVIKMDSLESAFDRIAERSRSFFEYLLRHVDSHLCMNLAVLSASRLSSSRRRCG
jgi:hypothetical protein